MPRTRLDRYSAPKRPAPDYPKGLILERIAAQGVSPDAIAQAMGIGRSTWFQRRRQPTTLWPLGELLKACAFLGVDLDELRSAIRYRT